MKIGFFKMMLLIIASFAMGNAVYAQASVDVGGINVPAPIAGGAADTSTATFQQWKDYYTGPGVNCWGCLLFAHGANVASEMAERGQDTFAGPAAAAVTTFMGLWVMWQLYLLLSVSHAVSPAQTIETIVQRLVIMLVILYLLGTGYTTWVLDPLFAIMSDAMGSISSLVNLNSDCNVDGISGNLSAFAGAGNDLLCGMQKSLGGGLAIGSFLMTHSVFSWTGGFEMTQFAVGFVLVLIFAFMAVILPFRFFDALVRIGVVVTILPLVILAFLFKPTRGVVKQAVTSILAAILSFLFTAIALTIAIGFLDAVIMGMIPRFSDPAPSRIGYGRISGEDFMVLLTAGLGMAAMVKSAGTLAAEFAGFQGQMGDAGSAGSGAIGGAMSGATKLAGAGVGFAAAGGVASKMGGAAGASAAKSLADAGTATSGGGGSGSASAGKAS